MELLALLEGLKLVECVLRRVGHPPVTHYFREQNTVTDCLAKEGAKTKCYQCTTILAVPPVYAHQYVWADILGTDYTRNINPCTNYQNLDSLIFVPN
ncbi:hypothetical protein P3L10_007678 [Capsicum annuum]